ncbi:MAG: 4Fe-4S dicluster domain-containing protein [Candidatus Eremiobacteraeota bacterium]|nr:4Fe-4S dicluster domain-containing protein [Candidatus Eremiobacteraeota bacterium]
MSSRKEWILTSGQCTSCGICADLCPEAALVMTREMAYPEHLYEKCTWCALCCSECPFQAIAIKG